MKIEHISEVELKRAILAIVAKHLDLSHYQVFFFGSRVSHTSRKGSDIDIGIEGPQPVPGYVMIELKEEIDALPTLYRFDVVDFSGASPRFKERAKKRVELLQPSVL